MWHDHEADKSAAKSSSDKKSPAAFSLLLPQTKTLQSKEGQGDTVVVLRSKLLGDATISQELGQALLNTFIRTTAGSPVLPQSLLLYGSAVLLAAPDSPLLEVLQGMAKRGCAILVCRTSAASLLAGVDISVGRLTDWLEFGEIIQKAGKVLWP